MIRFTDTHCHIHDTEFFPEGGDEPYDQALEVGIYRMICVGTDVRSSKEAVEFAKTHTQAFAAVGIHPHDSEREAAGLPGFATWCRENRDEKVVAIGEIGLDYHYMHSSREVQVHLFEAQLDLARELDLPVSFHVREAFEDFWAVLHNFPGVRGVLHSFTDSQINMQRALENGLFIGVNGIVTFSKEIQEIIKQVPLDKIVLETDAPYLTPKPFRGKMNVPGNVGIIASCVAELRGITVEELSHKTENAVSRVFF